MDNFGVIIHYGLYSFYGYDDVNSAKRRSVQNGSEWYYGRLIEKNEFRPISGHIYTKEYHKKNYGDIDYMSNINKIINNPNKIKEWVNLVKLSKASYVILTAKHHDGVCLWNTSHSLKSALDICKVFSDECKLQNIKFGFYYSWFEFDKPFTVNYFKETCVPQISELLKYNPNYFWFDGQWKITQKTIIEQIKNIVNELKNKNIIINDRIGGDDYTQCDYRVFSDRFIPEKKLDIPWQHVNTIGYSWGYNRMQKESDYKTPEDVYKLYNKIINLGGSFLLNVGPDDKGDIIDNEKKVLNYISENL